MKQTLIWIAALLFGLGTINASALPQFAAREHKPCSYCHYNPGGGGPLNAHGKYYKSHNFSFAGYDDQKVLDTNDSSASPSCKLTWKMNVADNTQAALSGVLTDDHQPMLVLLNANGQLTATKVNKDKTVGSDAMLTGVQAVAGIGIGHMLDNSSNVIVVPGGYITMSNDTLNMHKASGIQSVVGVVNCKKGVGGLIIDSFANGIWKIDPSQPSGVSELSVGNSNDFLSQVSDMSIHMTPDKALSMDGGKVWVGGLCSLKPNGKLYGWVALQKGNDVQLCLTDIPSGMSASNLNLDGVKTVWKSDTISGYVHDVSFGPDPQDAKRNGFCVLISPNENSAKRELMFFAVN